LFLGADIYFCFDVVSIRFEEVFGFDAVLAYFYFPFSEFVPEFSQFSIKDSISISISTFTDLET